MSRLLFVIVLFSGFYSSGVFAKSSLEEAEASFNASQTQTQATSVLTDSEFASKCINITNTNIECNTKMSLGLDDVVQQGATCLKIKCDSSSTANSTAETQCETTRCVPLQTQADYWFGIEASTCPDPYTQALCDTATTNEGTYSEQATQCRAECKACQSKDINTADDYNNLSTCSGTYGVGYDLAVKTAKGEAKKLQRECRKYCKGNAKVGWFKKVQLLLLASSLLHLKDTNETTGTGSPTPAIVPPTPDTTKNCSLETDEKKRVICYCTQVPGFTPVGGHCVPISVPGGNPPPVGGNDGNSKDTQLLDANGLDSGDSKVGAGSGAEALSSGSAGNLDPKGIALTPAELAANANAEKAKQDAKNKSTLNDSANVSTPGQALAQAGTIAGKSSESNSAESQKDKVASDIQKKTAASLFDSLSKFIYGKYKNGAL